MGRIESRPTEGLTYNPNDSKYWDPKALQGEVDRVFDICHGCRMCFNLCPSFPALFSAVDGHGEDVRLLTKAEAERVVDLCYQCKICEVKCPYSPRDGHEFQLDFPGLLERYVAVRARQRGLSLRDRVLGNPDRLAKIARLSGPLANWGNKNRLQRVLMEKTLGVHRDKILPDFASQTFEDWFRKNEPALKLRGGAAKVAFFFTCFVNNNNPQLGRDAVKVFERNDCAVACPRQNCCGMPALESGNVEFARQQAQSNVDALLPLVRDGYSVVTPGPSCSLVMRREYPDLLDTSEAKDVASAVRDTCEFLFELKRDGRFNREFRSSPGRIGYHVPCHLRAQNIGFRSRDMMKLIPGATVETVEQCTAHDGTWAMKRENFALSLEAGKPAFEGLKQTLADVWATDCPLAAIQFEQALGRRPIHPIQILARAYEEDGFPNPVQSTQAP
jgi:glycerol-3-phosphate dehydrogenase subunit C